MALNLSTIELKLSKKIKTATDPYELLVYSKALKSLKQNLITTIPTVSSLPDKTTSRDGDLYYVETDKILYVYDSRLSGSWRTIYDTAVQKIYSWGDSVSGILGDLTVVTRSIPSAICNGNLKWEKLCASNASVLAVSSDGTLWGWGSNANGRLGDTTATSRSSPVSVVGGFTDWCDAATSSSGGPVGIRTNGTLWGWGANSQGQTGDNTSSVKNSPVSVVGGFVDWCQVSAGGCNSAAVRTNGTLWTWGANSFGQLGDNTLVAKSSPVSIAGGFTDWKLVSVGEQHAVALRTNGTLWSWGTGSCGTLGDDTIVAKSSPVSVVGGFTDWCQVSAGLCNTLAIRSTGTLWAWGTNTLGQLGDGTAAPKSSPVSVVGGFTDWCLTNASSCGTVAALRTNGTLWAWGNNCCGQLADGTTISRSSPVSVSGGFTDWCRVSAGGRSMFGIRKNVL